MSKTPKKLFSEAQPLNFVTIIISIKYVSLYFKNKQAIFVNDKISIMCCFLRVNKQNYATWNLSSGLFSIPKLCDLGLYPKSPFTNFT